MVARRKLPDAYEIQRMLDTGITQHEVAVKFGVTDGAVSAKLTRGGVPPRQKRHKETVPWNVAEGKHASAYQAQMLRLEGRRRAKDPTLKADQLQRLDAFRESALDGDYVWLYERNHDCSFCGGAGGFHRMRRADALARYGEPDARFDTELIFVIPGQVE